MLDLLDVEEENFIVEFIILIFLKFMYAAIILMHRKDKEMQKRQDMLANLKSKANQMASALNMSNFATRDSLLGQDIKPADIMSRTTGLDNRGLVGFQRQVMKGIIL